MSYKFVSPDYDEYAYYIARAHELRAEFWRRVFIAAWNAPGAMANRFNAMIDSIANDKRVPR